MAASQRVAVCGAASCLPTQGAGDGHCGSPHLADLLMSSASPVLSPSASSILHWLESMAEQLHEAQAHHHQFVSPRACCAVVSAVTRAESAAINGSSWALLPIWCVIVVVGAVLTIVHMLWLTPDGRRGRRSLRRRRVPPFSKAIISSLVRARTTGGRCEHRSTATSICRMHL